METKSRYEVLSELEEKKRSLIKERDSLSDELIAKEKRIKDFERDKENLKTFAERQTKDFERTKENYDREKEDFLTNWDRKVADITRQKEDFERKRQDTELHQIRQIDDAKADKDNFASTMEIKKKTIQELIDSVEESLKRFTLQQTK